MAKPAKKAGAAALQTEVSTDEEWEQILRRKGLVVVDVYSEWSGPCLAMVSSLRKIKMEIGGDVLSYATARSDEITDLERFRGKSEPVWMFLQNGNMVNLVFGAHCPNLKRIVIEELRRVQLDEPPKWSLSVKQRGPEEEYRWQRKEAIRKAKEEQKMAQEEAEKRAKYEEFLDQEMFELCEEIALVVYPWVFIDDEGYPRDKEKCPAYTELVRDILPERFDILEQSRMQLDEEIIEKLFVESGVVVTDDLIKGLIQDKCMAIRLKVRPPPPEWPVTYPFECPEGIKRCPIRAINDAENYLRSVLEAPPGEEKRSIEGSYLERHVYVHEPDPEIEDDRHRIYPAVWFPPQARSKVHVFKTLFSSYMEKAHPYVEPVQPPPLCAFKFDATKFSVVSDAYQLYASAVENFGVFEFDAPSLARRVASNPEDFENKVKYKTGNEIFVIVLRRVNEEAFLAFAGNEPFYVTEDDDETERMVKEYFPPGATDVLPEDPDEEEDYYDYEDEAEEEEDYEDVYEDENDVPPSIVDLSMF